MSESHGLQGGVARFEAALRSLPPLPQRLLMEQLDALRARLEPMGGLEGLFVGPEGSPAFVLLAWLGQGLELSEASVQRAQQAMLALYLAVRIQDDLVDEGAEPRGAYLQQLLTGTALGWMSLEPQDWTRGMGAFVDAALRDLTLRTSAAPWTEEATALQGAKYLPMALPLVSLAREAGRPELVEPLFELVEALGVPLQLTNDLLGGARDLAEGQRSSYLAILGLDPSRHGVEELGAAERRAWKTGPLRTHLHAIDSALGACEVRAAAFELGPLLQTHIQARRKALGRRKLRLGARAAFGGERLVLDIELTRRCNLRCPDCFVFAQEPDLSDLDELPLELVFALLEEAVGHRTVLHLTGGEPFFYPHIWEVLERADALGIAQVLINTNGGLLDHAEMARLGALRAKVHLMVSIDGPPGVHERVRGRTQTAKSQHALAIAPEHGVLATPATILTGELLDYGVAAWGQYLAESMGQWRPLTLWPLFTKPGMTPAAGRGLSTADLLRCAEQVAALEKRGLSTVVADYPVINPLLEGLGLPRESLWQCEAGGARICVQADRSLSPCHPFRAPLGRVELDSVRGFVERARRHPTAAALRARGHLGCAACEHQDICGGCQAVVVGEGLELGGNDGRCQQALSLLAGRGARASSTP